MSRRRAAEKRQVLPDPIYNSVVLNKFINEVMIGGKKTVAQKIAIPLRNWRSRSLRGPPLEALRVLALERCRVCPNPILICQENVPKFYNQDTVFS